MDTTDAPDTPPDPVAGAERLVTRLEAADAAEEAPDLADEIAVVLGAALEDDGGDDSL